MDDQNQNPTQPGDQGQNQQPVGTPLVQQEPQVPGVQEPVVPPTPEPTPTPASVQEPGATVPPVQAPTPEPSATPQPGPTMPGLDPAQQTQ